ncbi:MAG: glycoside hydrolase family 127 protein [Roseburia sp.]|nr:glycoside hydrolase family 127 protein [Roseburia sp.]MCM1099581.1 glycoside hydrolase family 127 protein [Ruminococcus flavefaciens]
MKREDYSSPLDLKQVQITDAFWGREQELVRREVIPYQWEALNDRVPGAAPSYCMRNFKTAGRLMREKREQGTAFAAPTYTFRGFEALPEDPANPDPDRFYGFVFQDSDFSKWIEAVGYSLINHPDPELEKTADEAIDIVCAAQAENGYLDTYYIINGMDRIFTNLRDHHELYCFGHLAEGAIAYYQATGKDKLLKAAERYADFIASRFGPEEEKSKGYPGHEIAEMALARLYEATGERKYLELGRFFLEVRGTKPYYFDLEERERAAYEGKAYREPDPGELRHAYHQAHLPVREQSEAVGHAVRAVYLYSGMADVARLTGDEAMYQACRRLWDNIVNEKLYITGGIGGTHVGEAFSFGYDLPGDTAYSETCAAIGLAFFARRMLEIRAEGCYGDVMEQALYNTVLAGMALDGKSFFYVNPLEVVPEACEKDERKRHVKPVRQKWFGCACCPPNIARLVSSLGAYIYTQGEDTLYTHLYVGSNISFTLNGTELDLMLESGFPWDGRVKASLHTEKAARGSLAFRIPGWCGDSEISVRRKGLTLLACRVQAGSLRRGAVQLEPVSGQETTVRLESGYLYLTGEWQDGDEIVLHFPMKVRCMAANTRVRETFGKAAFLRGPICFCLEERDNGKNLHLLRVDAERLGEARVEKTKELGHEMCVLKIPGMRRQESGEGAPLYGEYAPAREEETELTFLPYYAWGNRGEGEMSVWCKYEI